MRVLFTAALAAAVVVSAAAQEQALTLREAADLAIDRNHGLKAAEAGRDEAHAKASEAKATWLPMLSVSETRSSGNNPVFVFASLLEQGRFGPQHFDPGFLNDPPTLTTFRTAVTARWALFDQLRRYSSIQQATLGSRIGELGYDSARQQTIAGVVRSYYGVALADGKVAVTDEAVRMAQSDRDAIKARRDAGLVVDSDLLAAEVQLADVRQQQIEAQGDARVARAQLNATLGRDLAEPVAVASPLTDREFASKPLEEWVAAAQKQPDIARAELGARIAALEERKAKGAFLPRLDAFGTWGASGDSMTNQNPDRVWGAMASLDILNPGRVARVAQARAAQKRAEESLKQANLDVGVGVRAAYERVAAAKLRLEVGSQSVAQASEVVRIVHDRYEQGLTTVTEMLRAQTALLRARLNQLAAQYDYYVSYAELLRVTGALDNVEAFS